LFVFLRLIHPRSQLPFLALIQKSGAIITNPVPNFIVHLNLFYIIYRKIEKEMTTFLGKIAGKIILTK
jgi:hypothetical protein